MNSCSGVFPLRLRYGLPFTVCMALCLLLLSPLLQAQPLPAANDGKAEYHFQIPAQALGESLILFGRQSGMQVTANSLLIHGKYAPAVKGTMSASHALSRLLAESGLGYQMVGTMVRIQRRPDTHKMTPVKVSASFIKPDYASGNMDLTRSQDDVQPYVIIAREAIEHSGATSVEDLLTHILPMSTSQTNRTANGWTGTSSQIDLRGLGASHTLVLINGRRGAGVGIRGTSEATDQQNINNIPLAAIERIEVLPTSASAIYGGNAIGGVINVVLRRDYVGTEVNVRYDNTFDSDQATTTTNIVSGFVLEDGRTHLMLSGQKQLGNALLVKDRTFAQEARQRILRNNPAAIYGMKNGTTDELNNPIAANPPYGALVNIRSVDGSPLFPHISDASFTHIPTGYAGWRTDGVQPLIANLGTYNLDLSSGIGGFSGVKNFIGQSDSETLDLSINRHFTEQLNIFLEMGTEQSNVDGAGNYHGFSVVTVPAHAPNNPFGQAVNVAYPANYADGIAQQQRMVTTKAAHGTIGFNWQLTPGWLLNADYTYSNTRIDLSYQRRPNAGIDAYQIALADGTLDVLRDVTHFTTDISPFWTRAPNFTDQTLRDYNLRATGTLFSWYAGDIQLATGLEHRDIDSQSRAEMRLINDPSLPVTTREQNTRAVYAELTLPFVSPDRQLPWLHKMTMQLAARHERFDIRAIDTHYSATSPTLGFSISPTAQLLLRTSYSEGFISPTVSQLTPPTTSTLLTTVTDPLRGNEQVDFYPLTSGNPELEPESSKSINAGFVYIPAFIDHLRISMDYYRIKKDNNITSLNAQTLVDNPRYSDYVIRAPLAADDPYPVGEITRVDTHYFNALSLDTRGVDTSLTYVNDTRIGRLTMNLGYTYVDRYQQQDALDTDPVNYLARHFSNDISAPLRHRINASTQLNISGQWNLGWAMQHYDSYRLSSEETIRDQGSEIIPSQTFHDLFTQYNLGEQGHYIDNLQFTLGIKNVFNDYQIDVSESDYISRYSDARLRQYYLNIKSIF